VKPAGDERPLIDSAIPVFGYKSPICIDRRHGIIRRGKLTDAAAHEDALNTKADAAVQHVVSGICRGCY